MTALDLAELQTQLGKDLRPTESRYSIILVDRCLSPLDSDWATKGYETNDFSDFPGLPEQLDLSVIALRADGAVIELA